MGAVGIPRACNQIKDASDSLWTLFRSSSSNDCFTIEIAIRRLSAVGLSLLGPQPCIMVCCSCRGSRVPSKLGRHSAINFSCVSHHTVANTRARFRSI
eukprot:SAG25_NODE_14_length_24446_cov_22.033678_8_plen_98_part_00